MSEIVSRDCKHGSLARSCEICQLEASIAELVGALLDLKTIARIVASNDDVTNCERKGLLDACEKASHVLRGHRF